MTAPATLFTALRIGALELANRVVMAPMTRNQSPGGVPGDDVVGYYRRRAEHGVGFDGIELHGAHGYLIDQFFWTTVERAGEAAAAAAGADPVAVAPRARHSRRANLPSKCLPRTPT